MDMGRIIFALIAASFFLEAIGGACHFTYNDGDPTVPVAVESAAQDTSEPEASPKSEEDSDGFSVSTAR